MRLPILFASMLVLIACGAADVTPPPPIDPCAPAGASALVTRTPNGLVEFSVRSGSTNACQAVAADSHLAYVSPTATLRGRLAVFLPGTGGVPRNLEFVQQVAAAEGFHVIGLAYPNDLSVGSLCSGRGTACYGPVRQEIATGNDASSVVTVSRNDAIEQRLRDMLAFLRTTDPQRGWGTFLQADTVRWDLVHVAGHSQGGGFALFLAQRQRVAQAAAMGSGGDLVDGGLTPAAWVGQPFRTPASAIYGFIHTADELVRPQGAVNAWTQIGLAAFGAATSVDGAASPWGGSHMLLTSTAPRFPTAPTASNHGAVAVDFNTPIDGGVPRFAPVWRRIWLGL